ncbi:MAG: hypothetical protein AAFX10_11790, partial [Pseudomonadota bacterium]
MTLKRQLLLVSLLTLMLPWAGCEFIRETESALRQSQQTMLGGFARAVADSLESYPEAFPPASSADQGPADSLFGHALESEPRLDGYFDDWPLSRESLSEMRGADGTIRFALGTTAQFLFLYVEVPDRTIVYADAQSLVPASNRRYADRVTLVSTSPPYLNERLTVAAEAPGFVGTYLVGQSDPVAQPTERAYWQDVPRSDPSEAGYRLEMRIPLNLLGTNLGLIVENVGDATRPGIRSQSFTSRIPGRFVTRAPELESRAAALVQPGMRLIVTDADGWRLALAGEIATGDAR